MPRVQKLSGALLSCALGALFCAQNVIAVSKKSEEAVDAGRRLAPPGFIFASPTVYPALFTAASFGREKEVRQLLADGKDIEERGGYEKATPLHAAAAGGHEASALLLVEHGADVSATDTDARTPLHYAVHHNRENVVRLLLFFATPGDAATARSEHGTAAMLRAEAARRAQGVPPPVAAVQEERLPHEEMVACPPEARTGGYFCMFFRGTRLAASKIILANSCGK